MGGTHQQVRVRRDGKTVDVSVNQKVYPLEVIFGAGFVFVDRAYVMLDREPDAKGRVLVSLTPQEPGANEADLNALGGEFANELLSQALRHKIAKRNMRLRELIVNRALYATTARDEADEFAFDDEDDDDLDFLDDPLGIAVPWEEKYGKQGDQPTAAQDVPGDDSGEAER